nr:hypothetical protein GCM10020185_08160 [Pseudomonas brassicacearum subsp. brassicacearum]
MSAQSAPLYPVVPGRLVSINGEPATEFVTKDSAGDRALQRDLSLTWAADLPTGNIVTAGTWWPQQPPDDIPGVSVEGKVAENLKIKLGDRLVFSVGGVNREAKVTSLREINWDNFQPNFFMIFQPGTLKDLPATYLTSFYLASGHDQPIVDLSRAFPAVTILQVEALLEQLRSILAQVTLAVEYVLLFVLAAGMAVLFFRPAGDPRRAHSPRCAIACTGRRTALAGQGPAHRVRPAGRGQWPACGPGFGAGEPGALPVRLRPALASASMAVGIAAAGGPC